MPKAMSVGAMHNRGFSPNNGAMSGTCMAHLMWDLYGAPDVAALSVYNILAPSWHIQVRLSMGYFPTSHLSHGDWLWVMSLPIAFYVAETMDNFPTERLWHAQRHG